ncbi:hypothetical protein SADUNF_Sadunf06G0048300 [Salix dunnii]|uniref:Uncharacterized protein n=1 Tax=Salix dunnii TaxID=1413687 RepID=A0A835N016_9ROSI|nr:hypothetical protein SADUNF_Sadunf06G0048300 [Salix dunnii]
MWNCLAVYIVVIEVSPQLSTNGIEFYSAVTRLHLVLPTQIPQRRILNAVMEPYPDSDMAINHAAACCLSDWSLEGKLFSITRHHPVGEPGSENLSLFSVSKIPLSSMCSYLSSIAKDVLLAGQEIIKKIRDSIKISRGKFLELKQQLQVPSEKSLSIDNQIQWNTEYLMLVSASELKEVFSCLDTSDPDYKEYMHESSQTISREDCSLALAIAVVMDPRLKMKQVQFRFSKILGEEASLLLVTGFISYFKNLPQPLTPTYADDGSFENSKMEDNQGTLLPDHGLTDLDIYIIGTTSQNTRPELDQYLEESLLPRMQELDASTADPDSVFDTETKELDQDQSSLRPETVEDLVCAKDWLQHGSAEVSTEIVQVGS